MVARVPSPGCRGNRLHKAVWSSQMHLAHTAPNSHHALTIINQPTFGSAFFNMWSKNSALDLGHPPGVKFTVWPRYTYQLHHYVPKLLLYTNISQTLGDFFVLVLVLFLICLPLMTWPVSQVFFVLLHCLFGGGWLFSVCFILFWDVTLAGLELIIYTRLASNSPKSAWFGLPSAWTKDMCQHAQKNTQLWISWFA